MNKTTNLKYLQTISSPEEIKNLIKYYKEIILSFDSSKRTKNHEKLQKYIEDLINYSKDESDKINIIPSFDPYHEIQLSEYEEEILDFYHFFTENEDYLSKFNEIPNFILQQTYNHAESGPVHQQVKELLSELEEDENNSNPLIPLQDRTLPQYRKYPILQKKIIQDENNPNYPFYGDKLVITPDGRKALSFNSKLVLWDLEIGSYNLLSDLNYHCAFADMTPDGRWALTSDWASVTLWDLDAKRSVKNITTEYCFNVIIRADGQMGIVILGSKVKLYDLSTWEVVKEISGYDRLYTFSITPDFKTAVWVSNGNLVVFDIENEKIRKIIPAEGLMNVEKTMISPDASLILDFRYHNMNCLWDVKKGKLLGTIEKNITDVTPDFKLAITRYNFGVLLDLTQLNEQGILNKEPETIKTLDEEDKFIRCSKITADGRKGVSLDENSNICVWDLERGESLTPEEWDVLKIILLPPGNRVALHYEYYFEYKDFSDDYFMRPGFTVNGGKPVQMVSFSDGEYIFISKQKKKKLSVFHAGKTRPEIHPEDLHREIICEDYVKSFHLSPSDKNLYIFTLTEDKILKDEIDKKEIGDITGNFIKITLDEEHFMRKSEINSAIEINEYLSTPDGRWLFMFPQNLENSTDEKQPLSTFKVWDPKSRKYHQFTMKENLQNGVFSPNGFSMAIKTTNGIIIGNPKLATLKNFVSGEYGLGEVACFPDINAKILVFTPDARHLVAGDDMGRLHILNMESLQIERTIHGHQKEVTDVKMSPDAQFFLSVSKDKQIKMWDLDTGNLLAAVPDVLPILSNILPEGFFASARKIQGVLLFKIANMKIDLPITTPIRMFNPNISKNGEWEDDITTWCPWCWKRFPVETEPMNIIKELQKSDLKDQDYQNPELVTGCPHCHKNVRINPFRVDYSD